MIYYIVYIDTREFPGANKLIGRYTRENGEITLRLKIKSGEEIITYEVIGTNLDDLIKNILHIIETAK